MDIEMTKKCAELMGYSIKQATTRKADGWWSNELATYYDPLHDDAQALALVRKAGITLVFTDQWAAGTDSPDGALKIARSKDLNRAIVECVSKMVKP